MSNGTFCAQKSQPHVRRLIRHQIRALVKKYTDLSGRVFLGRPDPIWISEQPCALVYFSDEVAEDLNTAPQRFLRTLQVTVDVLQGQRPDLTSDIEGTIPPMLTGEGDDELDDWMDSRAFEIEYAILHDMYLELGESKTEWLQKVTLVRSQPLLMVFEGDQKIGALRVQFNIEYETDSDLYGTLDEFLRFNSEIKTTLDAVIDCHATIRNT